MEETSMFTISILNAFNDTRELSFLKHDQCYNIIFEVSLSCPLRLFIFTFI